MTAFQKFIIARTALWCLLVGLAAWYLHLTTAGHDEIVEGIPGPQSPLQILLEDCNKPGPGDVPTKAVVEVDGSPNVVSFDTGYAIWQGDQPGTVYQFCL